MTTREIRRFRRALRRFERLITVQLKGCCATVTFAQCLVLLEVDEHGSPTMGQLAAALRLDTSTLTRTVEGLVERGLVERARDPRDRRLVSIRLTPTGGTACRSIHRENDACCREVFEHVPASERIAVLRNLEVLVQAFLDQEAARE